LTASKGSSTSIFDEGVKNLSHAMGRGVKGPGLVLGLFIFDPFPSFSSLKIQPRHP